MKWDFFKNKSFQKDFSSLMKNYNYDLHYSKQSKFISFETLKSAISENDFTKLNELYELILDIDLNIAGKVEQRKNALLKNGFVIQSEDKGFLDFLNQVQEDFNFSDLIEDLSDAIYYGINVSDISYSFKNGLFLPSKIRQIPSYLLNLDTRGFFLKDKADGKIYLDDKNSLKFLRFFCNYNEHSFTNSALASKLLYYSVLKHSVITLNLEYLDKNAIPPIITKTANISDEKLASELMTQLQLLKSNSFGIFDKEVEIDTLKQDKESRFLEILEYCDKKQNELILGGNLASSSQNAGSQALGRVHQTRLNEIIRSDAKKISIFIKEYLKNLCRLNLSYLPKFEFKIIVPDILDVSTLEIKSRMVKNLTDAGFIIPPSYIEKAFKITGVTLNEPKIKNKIEFNSALKSLPLSLIDKAATSDKFHSTLEANEKDLENIFEILRSSSSYEEAYQKLLENYEDFNLEDFENSLAKYIASSELLGYTDA